MVSRSTWLLAFILGSSLGMAHEPHGHHQKHQWLLNADLSPLECVERVLPQSYRARYNRPRYIGGAIAWIIEPTSQEALTWHHHVHRGTYDKCSAPPICDRYYYPKPWEMLPIDARSCGPQKPDKTEARKADVETSAAPE